ncbi:MAG: YhgE/Pip domain-containing protein [Actinomycetaceae bacterium]|nr:YhgE/Pip domain-containing protein [Actinomycetaceae bacterium]
MRDSGRVFVRDIKRILAVPRSLVIVIGILVTPALYTWLNILAFWNPYTVTENLPIAVVNADAGADSDLTGELNVGDLIVEQLSENEDLGWRFTDEETANDWIRSGDVYATFLIPQTFSQDLVDIFSGERREPTIEYFVNEKNGAIPPKITDAGANQVDIKVTSTFRENVGKAIVQGLRDGGIKIDTNISNAENSALKTLTGIETNLFDAQETLTSASASMTDSLQTMDDVRAALAAADPTLADVSAALNDAQLILGTVVSSAQEFAVAAGEASVTAQQALNQSSAAASTAVSSATSSLREMDAQLQAAIERANSSLGEIRDRVSILEQISITQDVAGELNANLSDAQDLLDKIGKTGEDAAATTQDLDALVDALDEALASAQGVADDTRDLAGQAVNTLTGQVTSLSARIGGINSAVATTRASLPEVAALVDGLEDQIYAAQGVLEQAQGNLDGLANSTKIAQTDVATLAAALQSGALEKIIDLDPENIGRYLASPVEFDQRAVYKVNSYGSAMTAMFINLSMWIGSLILVIIFRVEVDKEGFEHLSLRAGYMGRFMLGAMLSMAQGLIVSIGSLLIGVETASAPAFIATAVIIGPLYLAFTYGLAAAFSHVGRALAVLLIVLQIPGASGIYPIELMPGFFRGLYPLLPFSYGIDAIRETIGGFYDGRYWQVMGTLLMMSVAALILGFIGRRQLGYFTQLFYDELARTELVVNENVQLQGAGYRLSNIIALLSNRKEFSNKIQRRQTRFNARYKKIIRGVTAVGIAGLLVLGLVANFTSVSKPGLLGLLAVWGLVIIGALVGTEGLKSSLQRASELSHLSEDELFDSLSRRDSSALSETPGAEVRS